MKAILVSFLIIASVFPFAVRAEDALPQGNFTALRATGNGKVQQVIDPQTLLLEDGRIVSLTGINLPDLDPQEPGPFAVLALKVLKDMLEGQRVDLYRTQDKNLGRVNRMGHHLAQVERISDKAWAQGVLVSLGLARVMTTQRNPEMAASLYALEAKAREQKLGLWAEESYKILTPEEVGDHLNSFQIVEGRIVSAAMNQNRIYLNFGSDWRNDFTVSIAPADRRQFTNMGLDPLQWNGKPVRVRGWVESYNGPYIQIDHPESLELLQNMEEEEKEVAQ